MSNTMATLCVKAPVPGRALPLDAVPDPVFAQRLVGPGSAIDPPHQPIDAVAPIDGTLAKIHPHAFVVLSDDGYAVLVHLGIDTVQLAGQHFVVHAEQGSRVTAGQVVISWDVAAVVATGRSPIVPVVVLDQPEESVRPAPTAADGTDLTAGDALLMIDPR